MKKSVYAGLLTLILLSVSWSPGLAFQPEPGAIERVWQRTDLGVADGQISRTWMWGPEANTSVIQEAYAEAPDHLRQVQYFDKSRMEITLPAADPDSIWYVTNGLLVSEMIHGQLQVGNDTFEARSPATINVAGDADDPAGPTYLTLSGLLTEPPVPEGEPLSTAVDRAGNLESQPGLAQFDVHAGPFVPETTHAVASVFWDFMNAEGLVYENGAYITDRLFENPFFATGYPLTEAYWASVKVGGTQKLVLIQAFERRVLTYTPDNPAGFQVEAGNVGQHYFAWRYEQIAPEPPPEPQPVPTNLETTISALEIDPGDTTGDTTFGLRFVGTVTGDLSGTTTVVLNYSPPNPGPNVTNLLVGGEWSVDTSAGTLSGTVTGGSAIWNSNVTQAEVAGSFSIEDGTGEFAGRRGTATFNGALSHQTFPPTLVGTLSIVFEEGQ